MRLWFGRHLGPAALRAFLERDRKEREARIALYRDVEPGVHDARRAAGVRFGSASEEAVLAWLDDTARRSLPGDT